MLPRLQNYHFQLQYKAGTKIIVADTLSRAFPQLRHDRDKSDSEIFTEELAYIVASDTVISIIQSAATTDKLYCTLKSQIEAGWPPDPRSLSTELKPFHTFCDELIIDENLIFKGNRLFVPELARPHMIERCHATHIAINGCIRRAREAVF